jgi:hypothetical protein
MLGCTIVGATGVISVGAQMAPRLFDGSDAAVTTDSNSPASSTGPASTGPASTETSSNGSSSTSPSRVATSPGYTDSSLSGICDAPWYAQGCRIIAYYGNPNSPRMGVLGQATPEEMLEKLETQKQAWADADPGTFTKCALELIAVVAQADAGSDKLHKARASEKVIDDTIALARSKGCLTILDVQVGWSTVADEIPYLEKWLSEPDVHLGLDPEWDMPEGVLPGTQIGTMDASDINGAIAFLDAIVSEHNIGPKMLVVHRFRYSMVTNPELIVPTENIRLIVNMDGFGPLDHKLASYAVAIDKMPTVLTGMKLFYKLDRPMMKPKQVLALEPSPVFINYQ